MGMKFRFVAALLVSSAALCSIGCSTSSSTGSGTGALFVATQGNTNPQFGGTVSSFSVNLGTGALTASGAGVTTDKTPLVPSAMILAPSGNTLFVANSNGTLPLPPPPCPTPPAGTITAYTVKSDGTLTAVGVSSTAGILPSGMAMDAAGHFLFVANQGVQCDRTTGTISVFSVSGTALNKVGDFVTAPGLDPNSTRPAAVAVSLSGNFLYVANQFDPQFGATVTVFSIASSGALAPILVPPPAGPPYQVGRQPAALTLTPDGNFLYVANSGSNTVSGFAVCDKQSATCPTSGTVPDGSLTSLGAPIPAGLAPSAMAVTSSGKFLFVVDSGSNQISQYKITTGTGVLVANSPTTISSTSPVWIAFRAGTTTVKATGGTIDYLYAANSSLNTVSAFSFDSTVGVLNVLAGTPAATGGLPVTLATK
jgi:6-phosphogluconolactonase (cycloisomerase 2 family)